MLDSRVYMRMEKEIFHPNEISSKTSGTVLSEVHGVDKGVNPNVRPEKQIIQPLGMPLLHVPTETKDECHVKPSLGQDGASIKKKSLGFLFFDHVIKQSNCNYYQEKDQ